MMTHSRVLAAFETRVVHYSRPSEEQRAQGMPGEGLTHGPPANRKAGGSHHRISRTSGIPCAMVLTLSFVLSPGTGLSCPCRAQIVLRTWPQRREARTTRLLRPRTLCSSGKVFASIASRLTFGDDWPKRPLHRAGCRTGSWISEKQKQNISCPGTGQWNQR